MNNIGFFVLELRNAEGDPANEPDCLGEFLHLNHVTIARTAHVQNHAIALPSHPVGLLHAP